eukprot:bmy_19995T0
MEGGSLNGQRSPGPLAGTWEGKAPCPGQGDGIDIPGLWFSHQNKKKKEKKATHPPSPCTPPGAKVRPLQPTSGLCPLATLKTSLSKVLFPIPYFAPNINRETSWKEPHLPMDESTWMEPWTLTHAGPQALPLWAGSSFGPARLASAQGPTQTPQDSGGPSVLQEAPAPLLSSVAATEGLQVVRKSPLADCKTSLISQTLALPCRRLHLIERTGKLEIQEGGLLPSTIVLWKPLMGLLCWGREQDSKEEIRLKQKKKQKQQQQKKKEKYKRKNKSSQEDPGLVAWHPGTPDIVTRSPQGLDHSVLVETDNGQAVAEEAEGSPDFLRTPREGSLWSVCGACTGDTARCSTPFTSSSTTGNATTARPVLFSGATV